MKSALKKAATNSFADNKPKKKMANGMSAGNKMLGLAKGMGASKKTPGRKLTHRKMP